MMLERGDFLCLHEPFCTLYDTGASEMPNGDGGVRHVTSEAELIDALLNLGRRRRVFLKETTDHAYGGVTASPLLDMDVTTAFLVRRPEDAIRSHLSIEKDANCDAMGYAHLYALFQEVRRRGIATLVIGADDLVRDPEKIVRAFCGFAAIPYMPHALSWDTGHRAEWSRTRCWHEAVAQSRGIGVVNDPPPSLTRELESRAVDYVAQHRPYYERIIAGTNNIVRQATVSR